MTFIILAIGPISLILIWQTLPASAISFKEHNIMVLRINTQHNLSHDIQNTAIDGFIVGLGNTSLGFES